MTIGWSGIRPQALLAKFVRLAELRKLRDCEQVAAVCYRVRGDAVEFLLVKTGKGRWIFPKGGVEPGLTHAQAAALEAFEEAGVHGRMEEASFTSYVRRRRQETRNATEREAAVNAHLCEVLRLVPPQELDREPTWFSAEKAKQRLREGRAPDFGAELARVVHRAASRIRRSRNQTAAAIRRSQANGRRPRGPQSGGPQVTDLQGSDLQGGGLQKVQFIDIGRVRQMAGRTKAPRIG